jgi:hypothetical protein
VNHNEKKTTESSVAESVKLCIELDKKTKELWEETRESLKYDVQYWFGKEFKASDFDVLSYLLMPRY